jgi:hypothetical protein
VSATDSSGWARLVLVWIDRFLTTPERSHSSLATRVSERSTPAKAPS